MQELIDKVWQNQNFHIVAKKIEIEWLRNDIKLGITDYIEIQDVKKAFQAAAILACSDNPIHRRSAFRVATSAYDLFGSKHLPLEQALRVVLTRLDNFPSTLTRNQVSEAAKFFPISLASEEAHALEHRKLNVGAKTYHLTKFQHSLWHILSTGGRVAVAAPTSAGKSFVLQSFLLSLFTEKSPLVIYIVPTRALITQVAEDLSKQFLNIEEKARPEIITIPTDSEETIPEKTIFVMTQERVQILLISHKRIKADTIIIDEAHSISDGSRGVLLQSVTDDLLQRNPSAQLLFASPLIRNLDVFGRLFGATDIVQLSSLEPTVTQNFILVEIDENNTNQFHISTIEETSKNTNFIATVNSPQDLTFRTDQLVQISTRLGKGSINIIYANGADEAERIAIKLRKALGRTKITSARAALAELANESVHSAYEMAECLKKGVAFHYGEVPAVLRRAIEEAISKGDIDYLVCTSTLLQGVNLPAKNIFLSKPEKGNNRPLNGTDFWNLAGRAGRLLREFQGNIFLIEYAHWQKQPLDEPKDENIIPAMESGVFENITNLIDAISNRPYIQPHDSHDIESVFVRLLSDYRKGALPLTIERLNGENKTDALNALTFALEYADSIISLPDSVLLNNPNISGHKQQALYNAILEILDQHPLAVNTLIPGHPKNSNSFNNYVNILMICHKHINGYDTSERLSRFQAAIAIKWMKGISLPQIIQNQIDRQPDKDTRALIRETLSTIEKEIRFKLVRLFGCFLSLLKYALESRNMSSMLDSAVPLTLFLEVGASDRTMISLMSMGLSRVSAKRLTEKSVSKHMDVSAARRWLKQLKLERMGLSELMIEEVRKIISFK
ncbi:DEAD/DEAH box helicase [Pseudomonas ogarae]|uniref:DEAD/DEAH box helicase n=1 Tax=Pseudomonas ogarae (strain DSM 112162 / CECT 30235 / F113) TaxID=1114970 RepID=UPI0016491131|nr:DEAD/DEAH box helicase [Pseudomonas zarinae]QXH95911.1 DEAD/DEAH box helicase [Pseudomonas zarinae]